MRRMTVGVLTVLGLFGLQGSRTCGAQWSEQAAAQHNRGVAHLVSNRFDPAVEAFSSAATLAPKAQEPRYHLALALYRAQRHEEALAVLAELAGSARAEVLRGRILRARADPRWLDAWERARRSGELDAAALWHLTRLLSATAHRTEALSVLPELLGAGADPGFVDTERAALLAATGNLPEARQAFGRAVSRFGEDDPGVTRRLGEGETSLSEAVNLLRGTGGYLRALQAINRRDGRSLLAEDPLPLPVHATPGPAPGELVVLPESLSVAGARALCRTPKGLLVVGEGGGAIYEPDPEGPWKLVRSWPDSAVECAVADLDQDRQEDTVLVGQEHLSVLWASGQPATRLAVAARAVALFDYDRDGDADLVSAGAGGTRVWRNNRDRSFTDVTRESGLERLASGPSVGVLAGDLSAGVGPDLFIVRSDAANLLIGSLGEHNPEIVPLEQDGAPAGAAAVADWDNDGYLDLVVGGRLYTNQAPGRFAASAAPSPPDAARLGAADLDLDGIADLLALDSSGSLSVWRGLGGGAFEAWPSPASTRIRDVLVFEHDRRVRLVLLYDESVAFVESEVRGQALPLSVRATKDNTNALGSRIEVWAGRHFARQDVLLATAQIGYEGSQLALGLGSRGSAEWLRVTWPNDTWSSLEEPQAAAAEIEQPPDLVGSCPFLYAWNGRRFEFVSDFLGGSPLGLPVERGTYMSIDADEHLLVPGSLLRPRDGFYELRITEELREILYLDRVRLVVADHPEGTVVATEDGLHPGPYSPSRVLLVADARPPGSALDHHGNDVRDRISAVDGRYADDFRWIPYQGYAEPHSLTLEFDPVEPARQAVLLLTGGYYWSEAENFALSQSKTVRSEPPSLELFRGGRWELLQPHMPFPGGRLKTVAVSLAGFDLPAGQPVRLRISSNLRLYFDQVLLGVGNTSPADLRLRTLAPERAELSWHGYSTPEPFDGRLPRRYEYHRTTAGAGFGRFEGFFTRYGDVLPLLRTSDDASVVVHHGDQIELAFEVLREPPRGWKRDFFLHAVGWDKDGDPKTAAGTTVEPLPFRAMEAYPYQAGEAFPWTPELEALAREFQTRWISGN